MDFEFACKVNCAPKKMEKRVEISLADFPEHPDSQVQLTPRSRTACDMEGVDPVDLVYRPIESFADGQVSARLVKLRYDFFEAKRKDLLMLATKARERVLNDRRATRPRSSSATRSTENSTRASSDWGILNMEREKLARFQQGERKWLENCLTHELRLLKQLEADDHRLSEESNDSLAKMMEESRRIKEMNDRRRGIDEQKQRVAEAQQELEREKAKQAFVQHQEELRKAQESELNKKRIAHLKSVRDAEERRQKELEKKRQQDQLWNEKQHALRSMELHDKERIKIIDGCRDSIMKRLHEKMVNKQSRVMKSIEKNKLIENERKQQLLKKLTADKHRDERLEESKRNQLEMSAKKSLQLMLKRKFIQDESQRKLDMRRKQIVQHQTEIEQRLVEHEGKKMKYLEFKRELELLKEQNKQMNVDRQRKKEQYLRDTYATKVVEKDSKIENIFTERNRLWEERRKIAMQHQKSRDHVKRAIMEMRIKSKMDSKTLEEYVGAVLSPPRKCTQKYDSLNACEENDLEDHDDDTGGRVDEVVPDQAHNDAAYQESTSDQEIGETTTPHEPDCGHGHVDTLLQSEEYINEQAMHETLDPSIDVTPFTPSESEQFLQAPQLDIDQSPQFTRSIGDLGTQELASTRTHEHN
jgi:hypothetical protein